MASSPLPTRLAEAIRDAERCDAYASSDLDETHCDGFDGCDRCLALAASSVLRVFADMPEDEAMRQTASASLRETFGPAWEQTEQSVRDMHIDAALPTLRAASAVLLARQAGEMEKLREENGRLRAQVTTVSHLSLEELAVLRAQLRAAESERDGLRTELENERYWHKAALTSRADAIDREQEERRTLLKVIVEIAIPLEVLNADAPNAKWLSPSLKKLVSDAVGLAREAVKDRPARPASPAEEGRTT